MGVLSLIQVDLRNVSAEAKKKYPALKEVPDLHCIIVSLRHMSLSRFPRLLSKFRLLSVRCCACVPWNSPMLQKQTSPQVNAFPFQLLLRALALNALFPLSLGSVAVALIDDALRPFLLVLTDAKQQPPKLTIMAIGALYNLIIHRAVARVRAPSLCVVLSRTSVFPPTLALLFSIFSLLL